MHAFLIVGEDKGTIDEQITKLVRGFESKKYDFILQKIEDLRELTSFTKLSLRENTTLVIRDIDEASIETQNAFLKTLEEPQENLHFVLTAKNAEAVVPTILSRTEIIELRNKRELDNEIVKLTQEFIEKDTGEKIEITSKFRKREDALEFVESLVRGGHELLKKGQKVENFLESAQVCYEALKKNGNVQIQLTNFVVQSDK